MPIGDRFSTSSVTVTREPGLIRTSDRRRRTESALRSSLGRERGEQRECRETDRDHLEPGRAEQPGREPHREARHEDGHAAAGDHQGLSAMGTSTSSTISLTRTSAERPLMIASAVTMMRWDRATGASVFTSSGIT